MTNLIIENLKKYLKIKEISYKSLGDGIGLTESAIKKSFSNGAFSLKKLEEICHFIGITFNDLLVEDQLDISKQVLSAEQDEALAADDKLFCFFYLIFNQSIEEITKKYDFKFEECLKYLSQLNRLKLIDLYPNNKFKFLVNQDFRWPFGGMLDKNYTKGIKNDFFSFNSGDAEVFEILLSGNLTRESQQVIEQKLLEVKHEFNSLQKLDRKFNLARSRNITFYGAMRPWILPIERKYSKKDKNE